MNVEERFNEVYQKILEENVSEMEEARKEAQKEREHINKIGKIIVIVDIIIFIIIIIFSLQYEFYMSIALTVSFIIYAITVSRNDYSKEFKFKNDFKNVMSTLIKSFNQNLEYTPMPISEYNKLEFEYKEAEFERYDEIKLDDFIKGKLKNNSEIIMSDVLTQNVSEDSDGNTYHSPIFIGLFAKIEISKPFNTMLYLRNNKKDKGFLTRAFAEELPFDDLRIQLDSEEFEKVFDVYASDKIVAMQLLTADIMHALLHFRNEMGIDFELTLKNNCIYIRFWCGEMFESAKLDKFSLDRDTLYKYYRMLDFTFSLSDKLIKVLDETQY